MNQVQPAQQRAKKEVAEKKFDALFYDPPKSKRVPAMANKLTELQQKIEALQQERDELLATEKSEAIQNINTMIRTYGIRSRDLDFGEVNKFVPTGKPKVATKYKLGAQAWSGRGRKPKWVEDHVTKGGKLDELLVR